MKDETIEALILVFVGFIMGCIFSAKALLTNPTIIAAIIAAAIACIVSRLTIQITKGQRNIAKSKLDLDLFEKKFSVYDAIIKVYFLGREHFHNKPEVYTYSNPSMPSEQQTLIENHRIILQNFRSKYIEYELFFDSDDFLNDLKKYVDEWVNYISQRSYNSPDEITPVKEFFLECTPRWKEFTKRMTERIKVNYPEV